MKDPSCAPSMSKSDRDYRDEDDYRTFSRAAEIHGDKDRMAGVKRHHRKEKKKAALVQRSMIGGGRR